MKKLYKFENIIILREFYLIMSKILFIFIINDKLN
jgi:hypothetical protein